MFSISFVVENLSCKFGKEFLKASSFTVTTVMSD
jgi:hypothetical protein